MQNAAHKIASTLTLSDEEEKFLDRMRKRAVKRTTLHRLSDSGRNQPLLISAL